MAAFKMANIVSQLNQREIGENTRYFRQNIFESRLSIARNLYKRDLLSHFGCVNSVEFSNDGNLLVSGGDDRRVLLWKVEESIAGISEPQSMKKQHLNNILCLRFNNDNSKVFSGGHDNAVIVHTTETGLPLHEFFHSKSVYGVAVNSSNDQIFASACEDGGVIMYDLRLGSEVLSVPQSRGPYHSVEFHPIEKNYFVTANGNDGAALWDLRNNCMPCIQYNGGRPQTCMSARFNKLGTQVASLRRRLPPILYNTTKEDPVCQFYHPEYFNSCTMKSCTFAGVNDEYILSGSDDFNVYMWRINDVDSTISNQWIDTAHMVLWGHRSIVNQVRFNPQKCLIASSGVEKVIKLWQPFESNGWSGNLTHKVCDPTNRRIVFSLEECETLLNLSSIGLELNYAQQNTKEDSKMMAFFDSLVQKEIEGWRSDNSSDNDNISFLSSDESSRQMSTQQSDTDSSTTQNLLANDSRRNRSAIKTRAKYINRIPLLIASKRGTLKRLALRGTMSRSRRIRIIKPNERQLQRPTLRVYRKGVTNGMVSRFSSVSRARLRTGNDHQIAKNMIPRRVQRLISTAQYPHRKSPKLATLAMYQNLDSANSSSDDEPPPRTINENVIPGAHENLQNESNSSGNDNITENGNQDDAIPSTSSGITGNGSMFRTSQLPDSDDDPTPQNSPPMIRPPRYNGTRTNKPSSAYSSGGVDDEPLSGSRRHSWRKRNNSGNANFPIHHSQLSSHSSSRISSSSEEEDASTESSVILFQTARMGTSSQNASTNNKTPVVDRSRSFAVENTPDSGISSMVGSSGGSTARKHDGNNYSNAKRHAVGSNTTKLFLQKVARVRRNYRNIGDDSYSDDSE